MTSGRPRWSGQASGTVLATPTAVPPAATGDEEADRRWLTIRHIAEDLVVSPSTVYKWSARGWPWFPRAIRLRNGDVRVRRDWYEAWLAAQTDHDGRDHAASA